MQIGTYCLIAAPGIDISEAQIKEGVDVFTIQLCCCFEFPRGPPDVTQLCSTEPFLRVFAGSLARILLPQHHARAGHYNK